MSKIIEATGHGNTYKGELPIFRIGERYGKLVIIAPSERYQGRIYWVCRCDCGNTKIIYNRYICGGRIKSCGCLAEREFPRKHPKFESGQKIGRLTLKTRQMKTQHKKRIAFWICICECGNETCSRENGLQDGTTKSCGCLGKENSLKQKTTHGLSKHRLTHIHQGMMKRCLDPTDYAFRHYGARGIKICEEWLAPAPEGFLNFFNWALRNGYREGLSIDRIDVNGNYEPGNCQWASASQQARNRRDTVKVLYKGKEIALADLYDKLPHDVTYDTVKTRIRHLGWDPVKAVTEPNKYPDRAKKVKAGAQ